MRSVESAEAARHSAIYDEDTTTMSQPLFLEKLEVGMIFRSGMIVVESDRAKAFAAEFDPQPFHTDEEAARGSFFGRLVASGWYTAALTMRLLVDGDLKIEGGLIGLGVEDLDWPRPVYPGDTLRVESEVLESRPSRSRPDRGIIRVRSTTFNQDDQPVLVQVVSMIVPRRPT